MSDCDYEYLLQWKWYFHKHHTGKSGYAARYVDSPDRRVIFMHTIVANRMGIGRPDHRDRNKLNCRRGNLRLATERQNQGNADLRRDNKSGYKGVGWHALTGQWRAYIRQGRTLRNLGYFPNSKDGKMQAAYAYNVAAIKCFGEFAVLNLVEQTLTDDIKERILNSVLQALKES